MRVSHYCARSESLSARESESLGVLLWSKTRDPKSLRDQSEVAECMRSREPDTRTNECLRVYPTLLTRGI